MFRLTRGLKTPLRATANVRFQSNRPAPEVVATSLLDKLPGDSLAAKASTFTLTASVAAFLISKEIYIVDAEFFEMLCLFGAYYVWYSNGKNDAAQYFAKKQEQIKSVLNTARKNHKAVAQERFDHIGKLSDTVKVTESLYSMSKEIAEMEAEVYELKQKVQFNAEVKQVLDQWHRAEASIREAEQKKLAEQVVANVRKALDDPKIQSSILSQSIADLEKVDFSK